MDAVLIKVSSTKDDMVRLTIDMPRQNLTVDILEFIDQQIDIRIPDEKK